MILGVCSWLADVTGVSAKVMRLIFVIAALFAGFGILGYLILFVAKLILKK